MTPRTEGFLYLTGFGLCIPLANWMIGRALGLYRRLSGLDSQQEMEGFAAELHDRFANPAGLVDFIHDQRGLAKIRDNKLVIRRNWQADDDRVKGAFAIARDLARIAEAGRAAA